MNINIMCVQGRSSGANEGSGSRTSSVLPDLLSQAGQPTTPPRHDKSTSEEVNPFYIMSY